ncbi:MAG: DUF6950 family protein [Erythrobacter sp.]
MSARDLEALVTLIERRQTSGFRWGTNDCVRFAALAVSAQTGTNPLAGIRRWDSRRQALAVTHELGGLVAAIDARFDRVPVAFAKRGDIAGLDDAVFGVRLMIVEGATLVGPGRRGLERLPREAMTLAWAVPGGGA